MQFLFSSSYPLTGKERDRTKETSWSSSCYHYEFTNAQAAWRHIESTAAGFLSVFFILAFVPKTYFKNQCSSTTLNTLFYLLCPGICLLINHLSFHTLFYFEWPSHNKQRKHADNTCVCVSDAKNLVSPFLLTTPWNSQGQKMRFSLPVAMKDNEWSQQG